MPDILEDDRIQQILARATVTRDLVIILLAYKALERVDPYSEVRTLSNSLSSRIATMTEDYSESFLSHLQSELDFAISESQKLVQRFQDDQA